MNHLFSLPRAPDPNAGLAVPGAVWNRMADMLERLSRLSVEPPLSIHNNGNSISITFNRPDAVVPLELTATETGVGYYKGRILTGSISIADVTVNLALPQGLTVPSADNCLVLNFVEAGYPAHAINLPIWGAGLSLGMTRETTPRPSYLWLGDTVGVGQYPGMILQTATAWGRQWDFGPRAHGAL
jgi:hypothetical protein